MEIGSRIKKVRLEQGLSQEQMAEMFHVTRQSVSNWENNKNYPDLSTLVKISETFRISLDQFLKEDMTYIKENDSIRRKASARRWLIIILTSVLAMLIGIMIWFVHSAWVATDDCNRVTTQTNVKMQVNLPGQTPSRAITKTYDAHMFEEFSESEKQKILKSLSGKIEGDIPCVQSDSKENSQINLIFQDKKVDCPEKPLIYRHIRRISKPIYYQFTTFAERALICP